MKEQTEQESTVISIHALLAESDVVGASQGADSWHNFYPRSPCGERPWARGSRVTYVEISIHALLAESDRKGQSSGAGISEHFYPRSPCGERQSRIDPDQVPGYFYPRSPCGERL